MYTPRITFNKIPGVKQMNEERKTELAKYKLQTDAELYKNLITLKDRIKNDTLLSEQLTEFKKEYESACDEEDNEKFLTTTEDIQKYLNRTLNRRTLSQNNKRSVNKYITRNDNLLEHERKLSEALITAGQDDNIKKQIKKQKISGGLKRRKKTKRRKTKNKYFK